jgi:hypothetical protein
MFSIAKPNLLHKGRKHHQHEMAKRPGLAALVPGAGEVVPNGHLRVKFPAVDGSTIVYGVSTETIYRFHREPLREPAKTVVVPPFAAEFETQLNRLKQMSDAMLNQLADLDRELSAFEAARVAKPTVTSIRDIVTNLGVAAE